MAMLKPGVSSGFGFKRINYRLAYRPDIPHLASLVDRCKNTLKSFDLMVPPTSTHRV